MSDSMNIITAQISFLVRKFQRKPQAILDLTIPYKTIYSSRLLFPLSQLHLKLSPIQTFRSYTDHGVQIPGQQVVSYPHSD